MSKKELEETIKWFKNNIRYYEEQVEYINRIDSGYYDEEKDLYLKRIEIFKNTLNYIENSIPKKEYDKLKNENEEYKKQLDLDYVRNNYIPKEVIKKKIEKLDKEYKEILRDYGNIDTDVIFDIPNKNVRKYLDELITKIIILQELLERK